MKLFMEPEMEITKFAMEDVITTSYVEPDLGDVEDGGGWG